MTDYFFHHSYPALLAAAMLAWAVLAAFNARALGRALGPGNSRRAAWMALIFAAALILRLGVFAPGHKVYFDEFLDQDVAANLAGDFSFGETLGAGLGRPPLLHLPSRPGTFHVMLAAVYRFTGLSEKAGFRLNAALASASAPLLFLLVLLWFEDEAAAVFCAAALALLPAHIRFSATTELTSASGFWLLASLVSAALYERTGTRAALLQTLAALLCAVNARFEHFLLAPCAAAALALLWRRRPPERRAGTLAMPAAFLLLLVPTIALFLRNRGEGLYGFADPASGMLRNLARNLPGNLLYFVSHPETAGLVLICAGSGLFFARRADVARVAALLALGTGYALVCSLHPTGDFNRGAFERLAVSSLLCLLTAAAGGVKILRQTARPRLGAAALLAGFGLLCLPSYAAKPSGEGEAEYRFVQASKGLLDRGTYVLAYCSPLILIAAEHPAINLSLVWGSDESVLDALDDGGRRPLILFKDLWWFDDIPDRAERERLDETLRRRYRFETIKEEDVGSRRLGFYRLTRKRVARTHLPLLDGRT